MTQDTRLRWTFGLVGLLVLILGTRGFDRADASSPTATSRTTEPRGVRVARVTEVDAVRDRTFSGIVRAKRRAVLGFDVGGRLDRRPVEVGDRVTAKQVLARLDSARYRHELDRAQASRRDVQARLDQLRRDEDRVAGLLASRAATTEEVEQVRSRREAVQASLTALDAQVAEARRLVDETTLRAPFAGTITEVLLEPGEHARPGSGVVILSGEDELEVELEVPEAVRTGLREDDTVDVSLPLAGGATTTGRLRSIGRSAAGAGRLFPVVVSLEPTPAIVPGLTAEVTLRAAATSRLAVPATAVIDPGGSNPALHRVRDGRAELVTVEVGELVGELVTVSSEQLSVDDPVIIAGHANLLPGEAVEIRP
ncbi:MAG: efflux RND transporter periplasmic adaptor subunit [Acidobacteriota bacterium]